MLLKKPYVREDDKEPSFKQLLNGIHQEGLKDCAIYLERFVHWGGGGLIMKLMYEMIEASVVMLTKSTLRKVIFSNVSTIQCRGNRK